jgi:cytochrome oxidase Cu insertion factor (SCO1/SenC/PrrC family)
MRSNKILVFALAVSLSLLVGALTSAMAIGVGDQAPDFELNSSKGGKIKLSDLRGKNVLINFYRNDFDPT